MLKKTILVLLMLIVALSTVAFAEDDADALNNGDFEEINSQGELPDGWFSEMWHTEEGYTYITVEDINGNSTIKISNEYENDARIAQNVKVKANKTYRLSGWIYTDGISGGQGANLSFEDIMETSDGVYSSNGEWQYVELYGKTAWFQTGVKVFVRVGGYGSLSQGTAYFDNIKLEEVDNIPSGVNVISLKKPKAEKKESTNTESGFKFLVPSIVISLFVIIIFMLFKNQIFTSTMDNKYIDFKMMFKVMLLIGVVIRVILSLTVRGYPNDISCWIGWSQACSEYGLFNVYQNVGFLDYPPGYLYILNILGFIMKIVGSMPENLYWLLVKIPPIAADIILSIIIFKTAKAKLSEGKAVMLTALYFLNPAIIVTSSAWGQIDGILALFAVLYILALYDRKFWLAGIYLAIGVLMKIQMVLFAPLYLTAAWSAFHEYRENKSYRKYIIDVLKGVLAGVAVLFFVGMMPFFIIGKGKDPKAFIDLYKGSLDTYNFLSVNSTNLWTLFGGNWFNMDNLKINMSQEVLTYLSVGLPILIFLVIGFIDRKKEHIFIHAALLITGIFMLAVKMHERYMFPAIALLLMSVIYTKRRTSYWLFLIFTITQFINISLVLANEYIAGVSNWLHILTGAETITMEKIIVSLTSVAALAGYAFMVYICIRMAYKKDDDELILKPLPYEREKLTIRSEEGFFKKLTRMDAILMTALTLGYSVIAFTNLGSLVGPETNFKTVTNDSEVIVDFGEEKDVSELWFFRGKSNSNASFYVSYSNEPDGKYKTENYVRITYGGMFEDNADELSEREKIKSEFSLDGEIYEQIFFSNYPDVFKWFSQKSEASARYAKITFEKSALYMFEMGFKDVNGDVIPINNIIYDTSNEDMPFDRLFDEQDTIPDVITHMNSTYFDEIYHAGTAWEHINYVDPYETTHPPLGKVMMSWGIRIFGMNTFGWRFMGTLMGVLMVPSMYLLAKLLFKKTRYAFIASFLMTYDFMHFVQTRIATIDSYAVLFIILMYLFMGIYYYMSYNKAPLIKTLAPLGLSGIFFGLGAASKWICIYAGMGLAVIFFGSMIKRYIEYMYAKNGGTTHSEAENEQIKREYAYNTLITLFWCIIFFIIIPVLIYVASYIPIMKIGPAKDISYVWQNQKNMFSYHSGLNSTHPFASRWYEWPFMVKPMWFYSNDAVRGTEHMGSIATFGNPAVWWIGVFGMIYLFVDALLHKKIPREATFIFIAFLSQFLPWTRIFRSTFIYHYFASVPFIVLSITYSIKSLEERFKMKKVITYVYLGVVLMLFIMFYPVLSGTVIPSWYGKLLKWLPTWWFTY